MAVARGVPMSRCFCARASTSYPSYKCQHIQYNCELLSVTRYVYALSRCTKSTYIRALGCQAHGCQPRRFTVERAYNCAIQIHVSDTQMLF